jgi:MFS family permease
MSSVSVTPDRSALRRRTVGVLVGGVALGSTGHIAAVTVTSLVAQEIGADRSLAGVPAAAVVLGAALGATILGVVMGRWGRRTGLAAGYGVAVLGALVAIAGIVFLSLPIVLLGSLAVGFGNSSNQLSRYAAADLYPSHRRASAIGIVVWAATVGAVVGPNLVEPSSGVAVALGLPRIAGPFLVPAVLVALAGLLSFMFLRPDPRELADDSARRDGPDLPAAAIGEIVRRPAVALAVLALVASQFVMVLIMTMTPLHMTDHGHALASVGLVISAHTFGMFALAPISGRLTDRFGSVPVILTGTALIAVSGILSALAAPEGELMLLVALFLLGWGWNLGFVAGSALLTGGVSAVERARVQGLGDALIWSTAAIASLGSGVLLDGAGFASLGILGAIIIGLVGGAFVLGRAALGRPGQAAPLEPMVD